MSLIADALNQSEQERAERTARAGGMGEPILPSLLRAPRAARSPRRWLLVGGGIAVVGLGVVAGVWLAGGGRPGLLATLGKKAAPAKVAARPEAGEVRRKVELPLAGKALRPAQEAQPREEPAEAVKPAPADTTRPPTPTEAGEGVARATRRLEAARTEAARAERARRFQAAQPRRRLPPRHAEASAPVPAVVASPAAPARPEPRAEITVTKEPKPDPSYYFRLGVFYQKQGELAKAFDAYERLLALDPQNAAAHNNFGLLYQARGDLVRAVEQFQKALAIDPRFDKAHNNLGLVYYLQGLLPEAIREFEQAIALSPSSLEAYTNLGLARRGQNDRQGAIAAFRKALALNGRHAETHYNLALLFEDGGQLSEAVQHYQSYLQFAERPDPALAERVRRRIEELSQQIRARVMSPPAPVAAGR